MQEDFWQSLWAEGRTHFHEAHPNGFLTAHFGALGLAPGAHVFVPLCGKTVDLDWLLAQGHQVTGIEFNCGAVDAVFERLDMVPEVSDVGGLTRSKGAGITLWQGDVFALQAADLGVVDAVYDRAALVALPAPMRLRYAAHLQEITTSAAQLLVSFDYGEGRTDGPPFSVPEADIRTYYDTSHDMKVLQSVPIQGRLADRCDGFEQTWLLSPKTR